MATNATRSGTEGTEGGAIDVEKFLKENKLTYVADKFKEKDVSIEELFEFSSEELNEWAASDLGLDTLARKRLVKAVSALKPKETISSMPSHFGSNKNVGQQPAHVIVSPEEHEAICKLYQRFDDTKNLITNLESSFNLLEKSSIDCKNSVNQGFEEIVNELKRKEKSLNNECVVVGNEKKTKLLSQLSSLKEYCNVITNGKQKYEEYISDSSLDIHKRKTTIVSMIDDIINNNNVCLVMVTQPKIGFPVNQKQIDKFLGGLVIDDCDQPFPPILTIKKCGFNIIEIEWTIDSKQNEYQASLNKNVIEFAIEWTKVPKSNYKKIKHSNKEIAQSKSKNKSKKSKKDKKMKEKLKNKNKKKGKNKRKSKNDKNDEKKTDSSSESDSDDSDSDSDSDSSDDSSDDSSNSDSSSSDSSDDSSDSDSSDSEAEAIKRKLKSAKFEIDEESIDYDKLKWDEIKLKNKLLKSKSKSKKSSKGMKYKIKDLKDETPYIVRIRSRNSSGWGNYCEPKICITKKLTINSKILKEKEKVNLLKLLPNNLKKKKFKLIYRASVDSFSSYKFHQKCDDKGPTITIIRSTMNHVFGGYTSIPWSTRSNNYVNDNSAFIFLLRSTRGNAPVKWTIKNSSNAVYHHSSYGPTFGGGFDFYLCDNCNTVNSSYANLGNSYNAPVDRNLLAGSYNFTVSDYEVYQLC